MVIVIICSLLFILLVAFLSEILFIKKITVIDMIDIAHDIDHAYLCGYFKAIKEESSYRYSITQHKSE